MIRLDEEVGGMGLDSLLNLVENDKVYMNYETGDGVAQGEVSGVVESKKTLRLSSRAFTVIIEISNIKSFTFERNEYVVRFNSSSNIMYLSDSY